MLMFRVTFVAILLAGAAAAASAATFAVDAVCVDNVTHFTEGLGEVSTSCGVTSYPITGFNPGSASADSFASASAGFSGLHLSATQVLSVAGVKSGSRGNSTQTYAAWTFDDFLISGPGSASVISSLNQFVSGTLYATGFTDDQGPLTSFVTSQGEFFIEITLNGARAGGGDVSYTFSNGTILETSSELLEGVSAGGAISTVISSDELLLPVGQVFSIEVEASANASGRVQINGMPADENDAATASGGGFSDFLSTVSFPKSGPVFNLPAGYTVNSVSAGVVNNRLVPEPTALALVSVCTSVLFAVRRRLCDWKRRHAESH